MRQARNAVLGLLLAEGVGVSAALVACIFAILRSLMAHRAALFSVFLALPNAAIRALANKSVAIGEEAEDSDEGACARRQGGGNRGQVAGARRPLVCSVLHAKAVLVASHPP